MLVVPEEEVPGLDTTSSILLRLAAPPSKSSLSFLTLIRGGIFATAGATVVPAPAAEVAVADGLLSTAADDPPGLLVSFFF